jgi:hypothetical protein
MTVGEKLVVSLRMAPNMFGATGSPPWMVHQRNFKPAEQIVALRLDEEANREVKDYFLLPLRIRTYRLSNGSF